MYFTSSEISIPIIYLVVLSPLYVYPVLDILMLIRENNSLFSVSVLGIVYPPKRSNGMSIKEQHNGLSSLSIHPHYSMVEIFLR